MTIKNEVLIRVYIVLGLIVLAAIFIFARAIDIAIIDGNKWRKEGKKAYVKMRAVDAERGNILSMDGGLLATSLPFFEIHFDLKADGLTDDIFNKNIDSLSLCLATYVDTSYTVGGMRDHLVAQRQQGERYLRIAKNVSYTELERIKQFPIFNLGQYRGGFIVDRKPKRERPFKLLARRTIGSIRQGAKPVGLEGFYNKTLSGKQGKRLMQKVRGGHWIPVNDLMEIEPQTGDDIVTTIDVNLQDIAQKALLRGLDYHKADHGTAIIMDVKTGGVRAISNLSKTKEGWWEDYNHAIGTAIEPGSTFKLAPMIALLEDDVVDLDEPILINKGSIEFYEEVMEDAAKESFTMDSTTMRRAFEISSNVGIAKQVFDNYRGKDEEGKLRAKRFVEHLKKMNLHLPTGIEIKGEAKPYIKDPEKESDDWSGTTLPWMSIGYELLITPMQLLNLYNAVANDGIMMKPHLVSEIQHFGMSVKKFKPTVVSTDIASKETIRKVQELLESVVEHGTAKKLYTKHYRIAGKTGTSQINYRKFDKKKKDITYRASFVGYFPANEPRYSCIVVVTNPRENGIYGGDVAGPIFREIADRTFSTKIDLHHAINERPKPRMKSNYLPNMDIGSKEDLQTVLAYLDMPYEDNAKTTMAVIQAEADTLRLYNRTVRKDVVPNVQGMGLRDALFLLENKGLKVKVEGVGKVRKQSIKPGTRTKGQTIKLTLR